MDRWRLMSLAEYEMAFDEGNPPEWEGDYCICCGKRMIWQSDFMYEEVFGEREGYEDDVITMWYCSKCDETFSFII